VWLASHFGATVKAKAGKTQTMRRALSAT
jgi:hypothetical protein